MSSTTGSGASEACPSAWRAEAAGCEGPSISRGSSPSWGWRWGTFYIVAVRVRSDAARVRMKPWTSPAQVVAADGRRFTISAAGQRALDAMRGEVVPLDQEVEPGASYVKELVFDIPDDVQRPQLLIADDDWLTRLVIGNENSLFHRNTTFRLS